MKRMGMWGVALIGVFVAAQPAWATRLTVHEAAESQQYGRKAGGMIGRGLLNVVTCPVDLIVNTVNETKAGPPFIGTLTGLAKGTGCGILRLGSGALDVVTFWVPGFNGFPVSDSYENCMGGPAAAAPMPASYGQPTSSIEVPSSEPVTSMPAEPEQAPPAKKHWSK